MENKNKNKVPGWVVTIVILVILNLIALLFDWDFFFY